MKNLLRIAFACTVAAVPVVAAAQSVTVVVNGQTTNFSQPPIMRTGRVFVPLRSVFEQLGASVVYSNGQINATGGGRTISLSIGSTQATVSGQPETLDVAPFIVGATTYVPLRFISQALGASVNWDDSTSTVSINGGAPPPPPPGGRPVRLITVAPTGTIYTATPTLRFQFDRAIRLTEFRISVDGRNVSSGLTQNSAGFVLVLPWNLKRGQHDVRVVGTTASGAPFDLSWSFIRG